MLWLSRNLHTCLKSYHSFHNQLVTQNYVFHADFLMLIKIKAEHVAFLQMEILQIIRNLGFTSFIVRISAPDFQFNYKLLAPIVNDGRTCRGI